MLSEDQKRNYENIRQMARAELDRLDKELAAEVVRAKQKIEEMQQTRKTLKQLYDCACALLGLKGAADAQTHELEQPLKQASSRGAGGAMSSAVGR